MWNKRPDGELPRSYNPPVAGGEPAGVTPNPVEAKKETATVLTTVPQKIDIEPSRTGVAVIPKAVKIVGEIYSNEALLIEGFVQGTVEALDQKLTVGSNGTLHAKVQVRELDVLGTVQGDVEACDRVDIRKDAKLVGNIRAARIVIEDGAQFKGNIDIIRPEAAKGEPARAAAASTGAARTAEEALDLLVSSAR